MHHLNINDRLEQFYAIILFGYAGDQINIDVYDAKNQNKRPSHT